MKFKITEVLTNKCFAKLMFLQNNKNNKKKIASIFKIIFLFKCKQLFRTDAVESL